MLVLREAAGSVVDTANPVAAHGRGGSAANRATMGRKSGLVQEAIPLDYLANASPAQRARQFGQRQQWPGVAPAVERPFWMLPNWNDRKL